MKTNQNKPVQAIVHPKKVIYRFDFPAESERAQNNHLWHSNHNLNYFKKFCTSLEQIWRSLGKKSLLEFGGEIGSYWDEFRFFLSQQLRWSLGENMKINFDLGHFSAPKTSWDFLKIQINKVNIVIKYWNHTGAIQLLPRYLQNTELNRIGVEIF